MVRAEISALVAVVLLAGCGGDNGSSASEDYASGVCSTLSAWVTDLQATATSLRDAGASIDKDVIETAVSDVSDATSTLVDDLKALGPPETDAGNQAKSELDSLGSTLTQQVDTVEQEVNEGAGTLALATTVTAAVSTATAAVESTFASLQGLDPGGELEDGFKNADDCKSFSDQLDAIGS